MIRTRYSDKMRSVYFKNGRYYHAWIHAINKRKRDLPKYKVAEWEKNSYYFKPGWVQRLEERNLLIKIEGDRTYGDVWFVDMRASSEFLGCTCKSLSKTLEDKRHMMFIPPIMRTVPMKYGFQVIPEKDVQVPSRKNAAYDNIAKSPLPVFEPMPPAFVEPAIITQIRKMQRDAPAPAHATALRTSAGIVHPDVEPFSDSEEDVQQRGKVTTVPGATDLPKISGGISPIVHQELSPGFFEAGERFFVNFGVDEAMEQEAGAGPVLDIEMNAPSWFNPQAFYMQDDGMLSPATISEDTARWEVLQPFVY